MCKILFIDTFTTGLDTNRCAIYRFGGVMCNTNATTMKENVRFEFNIRPWSGARIIDNSLWLGGVSKSDLIRFSPQEEVFKAFIGMLDENIEVKNPKDKAFIAGFNASAFDVPFLKNWFKMNGKENFRDYFYVQTIDLMSIAAFALVNERSSMSDFYLESTARALDIETEKNEKKSCLENALLCMKIYRKLTERLGCGEIQTVEETEKFIG